MGLYLTYNLHTRSWIADILRHFSYDGVYATKEERVAGGGSLCLINYVIVELGLEDGDITGTWDVAHVLQLAWNKSIKRHPNIERLIKVYFNAMSDFSLRKSSTIFMNRARELGNLVLTPKKQQTSQAHLCKYSQLRGYFLKQTPPTNKNAETKRK